MADNLDDPIGRPVEKRSTRTGRARPPLTGGRRNAVTGLGRRHDDINADNLITKKLVIITVVIVDVLYLACDAAFAVITRC